MARKTVNAINTAATIWDKPEPRRRLVPAPLTREKIVRSALTLADKNGLDSVSLRNVGAALKAGPMRLYAYISTKEELLDLMVDALYAEMQAEGALPTGWEQAMRVNAQRLRDLTHRHPWFLSLMGGRPHQGPHALTHLESLLAVLQESGGFPGMDQVLQALRTIQAYVIGALQSEAVEVREARESGLSKSGWQEATVPHLNRMMATGRFPMLAKIVTEAAHPPVETVFAEGLECVLKGVFVRFGKQEKPRH